MAEPVPGQGPGFPLSPESRWLLSRLRSLSGRDAPSSPPDSLNWELLLTFAEAHGLAPALGFALRAKAPEAAPAEVLERLTRQFTQSVARHLLLSRELNRLVRLFKAHGVPLIPLKGLVLAEALYPHPALRPISDLDLLIRPEDVLRADGLLRDSGCRRMADAHSWSFDIAYDRATFYEGPTFLRVDLHWGLVNDPRYSWDQREGLTVWERAIPIRVADEEALGLCPEDLLLYLALHLAIHHAFSGLLWYWDLALLLDRRGATLDWEAVIARASRWRVRNALFFALLGLEMFFGVSAPASVMGRVKPRGARAAVMGWLLNHLELDRLAHLEHLIPLLLVDRSQDLLGAVSRLLWPPPAWMRARYAGDASALPALYLAHYCRLGEVLREAGAGLARRGR